MIVFFNTIFWGTVVTMNDDSIFPFSLGDGVINIMLGSAFGLQLFLSVICCHLLVVL